MKKPIVKTFIFKKKIVKYMVNINTVPAKSHINLFGQLTFIM